MMNRRLVEFINQLFLQTPDTAYVAELKEEMLVNLNDRYEDLLVQGKSQDEAYVIVTSSVGDLRELLSGLDESVVAITTKDLETRRKQSALITSIAVMMYIMCGVVVIGFSVFDSEVLAIMGVVIAIMIVAVATGLLIYDSQTKPEALKDKEKRSNTTNQQKKDDKIKELIESVLWLVTVAIYLSISFAFGIWHISWIIFLIAAAVQSVIELIFKLKE